MNERKYNYDFEHLYEERGYIEGILNQRVAFFIAVFAAILAAFGSVKNPTQLCIVTSIGFAIGLMFALVIYRAHVKLKIYLNELGRAKYNEANRFSSNQIKNWRYFPVRKSKNKIVGIVLPWGLTLVLLVAVIFTWVDKERSFLFLNEEFCTTEQARIEQLEKNIETNCIQIKSLSSQIDRLESSMQLHFSAKAQIDTIFIER